MRLKAPSPIPRFRFSSSFHHSLAKPPTYYCLYCTVYSFLRQKERRPFVGLLHFLSKFLDTCSFSAQTAKVVQFRTTYFTTTNYFKKCDFWCVYRECTLNTYT